MYEQLFFIIFKTGIVPDNWLMGNIKPIYKNKGDKMDPNIIGQLQYFAVSENFYKKYKIVYHYTYFQVACACTKDHLSKLCRMLSQNQ
jgi:hypothetical protein